MMRVQPGYVPRHHWIDRRHGISVCLVVSVLKGGEAS